MRILISAANADVCLSMARILKSDPFYRTAKIIGLAPDGPGPASQYFDQVIEIPFVNDPGYEAALIRIMEDVQPDVFLPFSEAELSWFSKNPDIEARLPTKVIINTEFVLNLFLDKKKTLEYLTVKEVPVPKSYLPEEVIEANLPVILKPRSSAGSKNMAIIRNAAQLEGFKQYNHAVLGAYVAQELIDVPDSEYTCALWRYDGVLRHCTFFRRLQGGMTGYARVEEHPSINRALQKIADAVPGNFFINVQLRLRDNVPYVFEINPRFSSTVMMRHKIGFSDFIWTLDHYFKRSAPPPWQPPVGAVIFRVSDECVISVKDQSE